MTYEARPARSLLNRQKFVTTAHSRSGDPRPMTPPATEVLRLATEKRPECDIDLDFRLPHERAIAMGWQVRL